MLLLGLIGFGMVIGALAQIILGKAATGFDWGMALVAGIVGSFVGGLIFSLIAGDGLAFKASGIIGSLIGAIITTAIWRFFQAKNTPAPQPAASAYQPPNNTTKNRNKNKSNSKKR